MMTKTKEQEANEAFMKEFFKTEIVPDTWNNEERFYLKDGKGPYFQADGYNKKHEIVWEYDGPMHYTKRDNIEKDKKRDKHFISKGCEFIIIPYFCTLTRTVARHYLKRAFDKIGGNFEKALTNNYEDATNKAEEVFRQRCSEVPVRTPGWHKKSNTPLGFLKEGKERFLKELDELPEETQHQIIHSLTFVLEKVSKRTLNNPLNKSMIEKIRNFKVKEEHIKGWEFKLEEKKS